MKTNSLLLLSSILSLSLLATNTVSAACSNCSSGGGSGGAVAGSTTIFFPRGKKINSASQTAITSVAGNAVTVNESKTAKTYQVNSSTRVFVDGNSTGVERLQAGMRVVVSTSLIQPTVARTIVAQNAK